MSKKVASELAVGIVILISLAVAGTFWVEFSDLSFLSGAGIDKQNLSKQIAQKESAQRCKPRFFEGEELVHGWAVKSGESNEVVVEIQKEDIEKLPNRKFDFQIPHFTAVIVDPTQELRKSLGNSSEEKPADIIVRGYAQACEPLPLISIQQATLAFAKNNFNNLDKN